MESHKNQSNLRIARVFCGRIVDDLTLKPGASDVTLGEHKQTLLMPTGGLGEGFCLIRAERGGAFTLRLTPEMQGKVHTAGHNLSISELIASNPAAAASVCELPLQSSDWGVLRFGEHQEVIFQFVASRPAVLSAAALSGGAGLTAGAIRAVASVGGASMLAAAVVIVGFIFSTMYLHKDAVDLDAFSEEVPRAIAFHSDIVEEFADEEQKLQPPEELTEHVTAVPTEEAAKAPEGPQGAFGDPEKDTKTKLTTTRGPEVTKAPKHVGVAQALGPNFAASIAANFGKGPLGNVDEQFAGMVGSSDAFAMGMGIDGGTGILGFSPLGGGGGPGGGVIGGLNGQPGGEGPGGQPPKPEKSKPKIKPVTTFTTPSAGKFCKADEIKNVVGKKAARIRNCYERRLLANPKLSGKVITQWKIQLDGSVKDAKVASSTMSDDEVGRCLVRLLETSKFTSPDGGVCVVEFPFLFSAQ